MRKFFKILMAIIALLIAAMIITPYLFKDKIKEIVKMEANNYLNARFDFDDVSISLFRAFPKASVAVTNVVIVNNAPFEGDTLLAVKKIMATVDISSLFGNKGIVVNRILLNAPFIQGQVTKEGVTNWDIMKQEENEKEENEIVEKPVNPNENEESLSLSLNEFSIKKARIIYDDRQSDMRAVIKDMDISLSGKLYEDNTLVKTNILIGSLNLIMENVTYINKAELEAGVDLDADFANKKFIFRENFLRFNAIKTSLDGWVSMPDTSSIEMDLKLNTSKINFKEILSLIPAVYAKDFESLKASGSVEMSAWAKGVMKENVYPAFDASLKVNNGSFSYESLPGSVDDIQIEAGANSPGGSLNNMKAEMKKFHFLLAGNPFDLTAAASNFETDINFRASASGKIDLSKIQDVYPMEDLKNLKGVITTDLKIAGTMSEIEKEDYEKIDLAGSLTINDARMKMDSLSVKINEASLSFTPKLVSLNNFDASVNQSDVIITGSLSDFVGFAMKDAVLRGNLMVSSNNINLNDFMTEATPVEETEEEKPATVDSISSGVIVIPANIDFLMDMSLNKVTIDNIVLTDVRGKMSVNQGIASLNNLSMRAFEGSLITSGEYNSSNPEKPSANFSFNFSDASYSKTISSVATLGKIAPVFNNLYGTYSMALNVSTEILPDFTPDLKTLNGKGVLKSQDVRISGVEALDKLADLIKYDNLKNLTARDLDLSFVIEEGNIDVEPFDIKAGNLVLTLGGKTGLDESVDYKGNLSLGAEGLNVMGVNLKNIPFTITGTFNSPKIALDTKSAGQAVAAGVADKVTDIVADKIGVSKDSVGMVVDSLIVQKKQETLVAVKKQAAKLIEEANAQADKLVEAAGNSPLKKIAAKKAAEELKSTAQKQADKLIKEAEEKLK